MFENMSYLVNVLPKESFTEHMGQSCGPLVCHFFDICRYIDDVDIDNAIIYPLSEI